MMPKYYHHFLQTTLLTLLGLVLSLSLITHNQQVPLSYFGNLILIAGLFGLLFGLVYKWLWQGAWPAPLNIIVATLLNTTVGWLTLWLLSPAWLRLVWPWWPGVLTLTIIGHVLIFYIYQKHQNKRLAEQLNQSSK